MPVATGYVPRFSLPKESADLPGRHINLRQKRLFMQLKQRHSIKVAAAKAG